MGLNRVIQSRFFLCWSPSALVFILKPVRSFYAMAVNPHGCDSTPFYFQNLSSQFISFFFHGKNNPMGQTVLISLCS